MTLVNTETGELLDVETAERRASYICTDLDHIAESFETAMGRMREAIAERDDITLGYRSPGDYIADRFGGRLARIGVDLRREVVRELTEAGLSTRAIAPVVGADFSTVSRDRARVASATPQTPASTEAGAGPDSFGPPPQVAPTEDNGAAAAVEPASNDVTATTPEGGTPAPTRPPVVGIDGKTYATPAPRPTRSAEQQNADEFAARFAGQVVSLLSMQHQNMRATALKQWSLGNAAASPVQREYVTPENIRAVADGLLALADEWEDHR